MVSINAIVTKKVPSEHQIEDIVSVNLRFDSGAVGSFLGGTGFPAAGYGFCLRFESVTLSSERALDPGRLTVETAAGFRFSKEEMTFSREEPLQVEVGQWLASLQGDLPMPISGEDARKSVALVEAAYNSATPA